MKLTYFCAPIQQRVFRGVSYSWFGRAQTTFDSVAQLVEQYTFNVWVLGSSPSQITEKTLQQCKVFFMW